VMSWLQAFDFQFSLYRYNTPQRAHSHAAVARYALVKFALIVLATELFTHTVYANAMAISRVGGCSLTPGCQIVYVDHTGCHKKECVLRLQNNVT
jgi:hypothetical protein